MPHLNWNESTAAFTIFIELYLGSTHI